MTKLPLCSSDDIVAALGRAGFEPALRSTAGTHMSMSKTVGHRKVTTVVILGKREVPRGTLRAILDQARIPLAEFLALLGRKQKGGR